MPSKQLSQHRERALDLVQDTCERALRFRHLFHEGTNLPAWALTIMRHRFLDMAKTRDAVENGKCVPLEELSEWARGDARAEQIWFAKEALGLARARLSEERFLAHPGGRDTEGVCGSLWDPQGDSGHSATPRPVLHAPCVCGLMEEDGAWRGRRCAVAQTSSFTTANDLRRRILRLRPPVTPDCAGERGDDRRETPARDRHQRDLADDFRVGNEPSDDAGDSRRKLRDKADAEAGGDHHLDPVLALATEADLDRESVLAAALVQVVYHGSAWFR